MFDYIRAGCLAAGVSTLAMATASWAQTASPVDRPSAQAQTEATGTSQIAPTGTPTSSEAPPEAQVNAGDAVSATPVSTDPQSSDIVVTGSRTIQNGNSMPTPVTVISAQQLNVATARSPIDALQTLPSVGGSNPRSIGGASNAAGNSGGRTLNLRGVGSLRTLVLFDGQRIAPSSVGGEVNVDLVPSLLLQRVDIVTGGTSAVYGSDAVAGVVNFVTDRAYTGLKIDAQGGISKYGDGGEQKFGIAAGRGLFDGRVHVEGSYEYQNDELIAPIGKRPWAAECVITGVGTAAVPYNRTCRTRNSALSAGGRFANTAASGPLRDLNFAQNGILSPFVHGVPTGSTGFESGGDGEYFPFASLQAGSRTHKAFGRVDADVVDGVHFFGQVAALWAHNTNVAGNVRLPNYIVSAQNAYLAPAYQQQLAAAGIRTLTFSKDVFQAGGVTPETRANSLLATAGLEGRLAGFKWNLGYSHSRNRQSTFIGQNLDRGKVFAALDAVVNPANGQVVCNVTLTNPTAYPGCVPVNLFGPTSASPEALAYLLTRTGFRAVTVQDQFGGSVAGSPFSTWAGPVQIALSGEYRKQTLTAKSTANPNELINCTGIRFNTCNANVAKYTTNAIADTRGSQTVKEIALEGDIPLLDGMRFARTLSLNGAARYTDYRTSGSVVTWKAGLVWSPDDQVTFRATRSRDIRAPSLNDLFAPSALAPGIVVDRHLPGSPLINANALTRANPNLVPEIARTYTVGVVLRPSFAPTFSLAVDYFNIRIRDAITTLTGTNATVQNVCEASNGTSAFCDLIVRPLPFADRTAANAIVQTITTPVNAASFFTEGVDVEANYRTEMLGGNLTLRGLLTYQPKIETQQGGGFPRLQLAGIPDLTKVRATAQVSYAHGPFTINVQERYRGRGTYNQDRTAVYAIPDLKAAAYTNVTGTVRVGGKSEFFVSVENLFDKDPYQVGFLGAAPPFQAVVSPAPGINLGTPPGDDVIGRYFLAGFRIRL